MISAISNRGKIHFMFSDQSFNSGNYSVGLRNPQIQHKVENWKGTEKNSEMSIYKKGKRWYAEEKEWW